MLKFSMRLQDLHVYHLKKKEMPLTPMELGAQLLEGGFHLVTCQRELWISNVRQHELMLPSFLEYFHAESAYHFLLRFVCGLESEIQGETDVFGQFKDAWQEFKKNQNELVQGLSAWVQRLFEDTKEIRSHYLQNMGGHSYGSLIRRLLKGQAPSSPILIVGAGQIAQSIAPFLLDFELILTNRSAERRELFHQSLVQEHAAKAIQVHHPEHEIQVWKEAGTIIICTPLDLEFDQKRISWFLEGGHSGRRVIHLGGHRRECGEWACLSRFFALDDLFSLQSSLDLNRKQQILQAEKACEQRAKLRSLGNSLHIAHGWEDLACFA